jgi:hypothetical protein
MCLQEWLQNIGCDLSGLQAGELPTPRAWQVFEEDGRRTQVSSVTVKSACRGWLCAHHKGMWCPCTYSSLCSRNDLLGRHTHPCTGLQQQGQQFALLLLSTFLTRSQAYSTCMFSCHAGCHVRLLQVWRSRECPELYRQLRPSFDTLPPAYQAARHFHIGIHAGHPPMTLLRQLREAAHARGGAAAARGTGVSATQQDASHQHVYTECTDQQTCTYQCHTVVACSIRRRQSLT